MFVKLQVLLNSSDPIFNFPNFICVSTIPSNVLFCHLNRSDNLVLHVLKLRISLPPEWTEGGLPISTLRGVRGRQSCGVGRGWAVGEHPRRLARERRSQEVRGGLLRQDFAAPGRHPNLHHRSAK